MNDCCPSGVIIANQPLPKSVLVVGDRVAAMRLIHRHLSCKPGPRHEMSVRPGSRIRTLDLRLRTKHQYRPLEYIADARVSELITKYHLHP